MSDPAEFDIFYCRSNNLKTSIRATTPNRALIYNGPLNHRPFIVPVFIPHAGCPHRCIFCNQELVSGSPEMDPGSGNGFSSVGEFLRFRGRRQGPAEIAFFGGNFLGLPVDQVQCLLAIASEWVHRGELDGIRFSTRPDSVDSRALDLIDGFPITCVELGVQSMHDGVLRRSGRGHTAADTTTAVQRLRARGHKVGLQLMVGLPEDDEVRLLETGQRIAALIPDFVRIYPTLVLLGSVLAKWFREGRYRPLSLDEAVDLSMKLYLFFRQRGIPVIRTGLQPSEELASGRSVIAGPYHPAFGHLVQSACYLEAVRGALRRRPVWTGAIDLRVHPSNISRMRGQGNANCAMLQKEFGFSGVRVVADSGLQDDLIMLPDDRTVRVYEPVN
jgi:histone acetyltransferase (RNA polymerase elongator complex component)